MLTIAARDRARLAAPRPRRAPRPLLVAGACGRDRSRRVAEARLARGLGYDAVLLSLAACKGASEDELIAHCAAVAAEMPLIGFYLQPAVGGLDLGAAFWARFAAIDNVVAIKVAPFNRYRTLDVVRGVSRPAPRSASRSTPATTTTSSSTWSRRSRRCATARR